ncbi:hypothetical protein DICPUDRAFT_156460 [Dictyostelium purpureum]|uniref:Uncharacterized protein n=1 Tax=Dictyostelium purpureum TaxID=5786 RepID=F0ZWM3_DICPU|nr:uncharacterized protein DICPUDRAFT_156460 [Dictyostelium purpureum]EGC31649.1 hypothetical protein DICPUDRAFT_156460 [Dictyostelium purpureum]|eukprot:XP_003291815.1 hypothetical protein DICPUDRAFT_156460 [Dictyostelium purpureum]
MLPKYKISKPFNYRNDCMYANEEPLSFWNDLAKKVHCLSTLHPPIHSSLMEHQLKNMMKYLVNGLQSSDLAFKDKDGYFNIASRSDDTIIVSTFKYKGLCKNKEII